MDRTSLRMFKEHIAEAAKDGIMQYLSSRNAADVFGTSNFRVSMVPHTPVVLVEVRFPRESAPTFFEVAIKVPLT